MEQETFDTIIGNSITVLLALIAGMVALIQVKSNIISSARIKWQEDLRTDAGELGAVIMNAIHLLRIAKEYDKKEHWDKYDAELSRFNALTGKMQLYNRNEDDHQKQMKELILKIDAFMDSDNEKNINQQAAAELIEELNKTLALVLSADWKRSKRIFNL